MQARLRRIEEERRAAVETAPAVSPNGDPSEPVDVPKPVPGWLATADRWLGDALPRQGIAFVGLLLLSLVAWGLASRGHVIPALFPDEILYSKISQSIAAGHGSDWRGTSQGLPPVYPYAIAPGWLFGSAPAGYAVVKLLGVVYATLTAVPVWLLTRTLAGPRRALIAATLTLAGSWMTLSGLVLSENVGLPLATAALCATVMALRRPGTRWIWIAFGFAAAAAATRVILFVLPGVILGALILDVLRDRDRRSERIRSHAPALAGLLGVGLLALGWIIATGANGIGRYNWPRLNDLGGIVTKTGEHGLLLIAMVVVLPLAVGIALALRPSNWRDDVTGPLLSTLVPAVAVSVLVAGWFTGPVVPWGVERYLTFAVPLLLIALVLSPGRVGRGPLIGIVVVLGGLLAALPEVAQGGSIEQPAAWGSFRAARAIGLGDPHIVIVIAAIGVGVCGALLVTSRRVPTRVAVVAASLLVAIPMLLQVQGSEHWAFRVADKGRAELPKHLDWVDRAVDGPVSMVALGKPQSILSIDLLVELFNRNINTVFRDPTDRGASIAGNCRWRVEPTTGAFSGVGSDCPALEDHIVLQSGTFAVRFRDQRAIEDAKRAGRLLQVPANPRLLSLVREPCFGTQCFGTLTTVTWLDRGGPATARFGGGQVPATVSIGGRLYPIPPLQSVDVPFRLAAGTVTTNFALSWQSTAGAPHLESMVVRPGGRRIALY